MYRAIPEVNRPVRQRQLQQARRIHLQHLEELRPHNLTNIEDEHTTGLSHKKKQMLSENKYTEIERENRILFSKISDIMLQRKSSPKSRERDVLFSPSARMSKGEYKHSLNLQYRRREFQRIEVENAKLLKRLQTKKSPYQANRLQKEWEQKKQVIRNMSSFPVILFDKVAEAKPASSKSFKGYTSNTNLNETADFKNADSNRLTHSNNPDRRKSNREIKISNTLKIDGQSFIVTVRLTSERLLIQAVLSRKRNELKIIEINREEALDFIYHECGNSIDNIFQKLRYDGQTLFLVAGESTNSVSGHVDKKLQQSKPLLKIDGDAEVDIEPKLVRLPLQKRIVASSLQRIEEGTEPQPPQTNSDWNKATI